MKIRHLFLAGLFALALVLNGSWASADRIVTSTSLVTDLPATCAPEGNMVVVTDGTDAADCSTGSGSTIHACYCDAAGTGWDAQPAGSGSPGGSDTHVQYNNATAFGGEAFFTYEDGVSKRVMVQEGASQAANTEIFEVLDDAGATLFSVASDASNNPFVGIGTDTPFAQLEVEDPGVNTSILINGSTAELLLWSASEAQKWELSTTSALFLIRDDTGTSTIVEIAKAGRKMIDIDVSGTMGVGTVAVPNADVNLGDGTNQVALSFSGDRMFHDTDSDGTKDAGEEFIDAAATTTASDALERSCGHFILGVTGDAIAVTDEMFWRLPNFTGTLTGVYAEVISGTGFTFDICDGEDIGDDTCTTSVLGSPLAVTTAGQSDTTLSATGFVARDKLSLVITSVTASPIGEIFVTCTVD